MKNYTNSNYLEKLYIIIYLDLLEYCKHYLVKVIHCKSKVLNGALGDYSRNIIRIDKSIRNTELGITTLSHELGHWQQDRHKKYRNVFNLGDKEYLSDTEENLKMIINMEQEANAWALEFLKKRYLVSLDFGSLNEKLNDCEISFYKKYYLK